MATAGAIPSSSLGKISRWYNAQKAAGRKINPWELEAAYRGELGNLSGQQTTNRSITLNEKNSEEQKRMNEVNTALARERMLAEKEYQDKVMAQREEEFGAQNALALEAAARAQRMEERQIEIDAFERKSYTERTEEDKRRYEQNRADQEADRNAQKSMTTTNALTSVGVLGGLSLLKDSKPLSWLSGNKPEVSANTFMTDYERTGGSGGGITESGDVWKTPTLETGGLDLVSNQEPYNYAYQGDYLGNPADWSDYNFDYSFGDNYAGLEGFQYDPDLEFASGLDLSGLDLGGDYSWMYDTAGSFGDFGFV